MARIHVLAAMSSIALASSPFSVAAEPSSQAKRVERRATATLGAALPTRSRRPCLAKPNSDIWSLEGTLITPDEVIEQGILTIAANKIASVSAAPAGGPPRCSTKIDGIILPGLIDLHNHLTWNVHPRWHPPARYENRKEWRQSIQNKQVLGEPQTALLWTDPGPELGCEANLHGEVKAIVGGATSVVGSLDIGKNPYDERVRCITGLIRNLDYDSRFPKSTSRGQFSDSLLSAGGPQSSCGGDSGAPIRDVVVNEVFPLGNENTPPISADRANYLKCNLASGKLRSLLVHLAEGKPTDPASAQEFHDLEALGLIRDGLIIVHGTALHRRDFVAVKKGGAGLVWSPRSNMELYGVTLNIPAAQSAGVSIAIAPDWSPTGSDGMLQELNYVRTNFGAAFSAEQLTRMATSIPARLARIDDRIGQLKTGLYADLLVIRRKPGSAYDAVITASPADVQLVVIDGRPVYGDRLLMQRLAPGKPLALMTICGASKAIDLGQTIAAGSSWEAIQTSLQDGLSKRVPPTNLSQLECPSDRLGNRPDRPTVNAVTPPDIVHNPAPDAGQDPAKSEQR